MKKLLTITFLTLFTSFTFGQAFPIDAVVHDGSTGSDYTLGMCVDVDGSKIITGKFKTEIDFGNGVIITPVDNYDGFVAKYDSENNIQWARSFSGYIAEGDVVEVDSVGNVIVAAAFFSTISFGTDTLTSYGNFDIAVIKFDADGNYLWMKQAHTENQDKAADLKIDSQGNIVLLGYFDVNDSLTLPFTYESLEITTSYGERDVFVIKMDSDGNPLWYVNGGGTDNDYAGGLAIDADDNIYFNGNYDNVEAHFGAITLPNVDGYEVFTAKVSSAGAFEWAVAATGEGDDKGMGIDFMVEEDGTGYVLSTGYFEDTLSVGSSEFVSNGNDDVFLFSLFADDGDYSDGISYGGEGEDQARRINYVHNSDGNYFISGVTKGDLPTPDGTLTNFGARDGFVLYFHQHDLVWANNYGGDSYDYINDAALDINGVFYFAGNVKSSVSYFDRFQLVSKGSYDLYLAQLHIPLPLGPPVILGIEDIPNDQGGKVRIFFSGTELASSYTIWRQIGNLGGWDALGSFNGVYRRTYAYVAQTLGDSTVEGVHWSKFKISAHTNNVLNFFVSEADSGYSIDNLAPAVPSNIIADGFEDRVELAWDDNEDNDFKYYAIYRSLDSEFDPDTMNTFTYSTIDGSFNDDNVEIGNTYYYKIVAVDFSGNQSEYSEQVYALITDVNADVEIPTVYELGQNYPNPFNPSTVINYSIPESGLVTLKVFDILGQEVAELVNTVKQAGVYNVSFDANDMTTGLYIYRIESGSFTATKKMLLVK